MNNAPDVSVVMANYNGRRYLAEALDSLQMQTLCSWELLFVDDASDDLSVDLVRTYADTDKRIRILEQPTRLGPGAARNVALKAVRGEWVAIFDSDDMMEPTRLAALRERAMADGAVIVVDDLFVVSDSHQTCHRFLPNAFTAVPRWIDLAEFVDSNRRNSRLPNLGYLKPFINARFLLQSGVHYRENLRIGEDYEFLARLLARGEAARLEPSPLYRYRTHAGSTSHRLSKSDIVALLQADRHLSRDLAPLDADVAKAFLRRRRSLESLVRYYEVVGLIKGRQFARAAIGILNPVTWPWLTELLKSRLERGRAAQSRVARSTERSPSTR